MSLKFYITLMFVSVLCFACDDENEIPFVDENWVETGEHEKHKFVDLGLASGALWAIEDVTVSFDGSQVPFFSWAEVAPKKMYGKSNYKYCQGADSTFTKYCTSPVFGGGEFTDGLSQLCAIDDAAQKHWKGSWYTPTWDEWQELYQACTWTTENRDGKLCFIGTSKINGKEITFSSVGAKQGAKILYEGNGAFYWSSTLMENNSYAYGLSFSKTTIGEKAGLRYIGHCIRPVIPGDRVPSKAVDLGLPSGVKWADTNIGASSPIQPGSLYAWGESVKKPFYDFSNYKHCEGTPKSMNKYCINNEFGRVDGKMILDAEDDAAVQLWGNGWRMPTKEEIQELLDYCTWSFTESDGVKGYQVIGKNGNSIYIPLAGTKWQTEMEFVNMRGFYWSSTIDDEGDMYAEGLFLSPKQYSFGSQFTRASGRTIRPVCN